MPNFAIIGRNWGEIGELWRKGSVHAFPKQMSIDYNDRGVIYGFVCEYRWNQKDFDELRDRIQKTVRGEQKVASSEFLAWRDEEQKLTVTLFRDRDAKLIRVTAISIDTTVRRSDLNKQ